MRRYFIVGPEGDVVEVIEVDVVLYPTLDEGLFAAYLGLVSGHRGGI